MVEVGTFEDRQAELSLLIEADDIKNAVARKYQDIDRTKYPSFATIAKYHAPEVSQVIIEQLVRELKNSVSYARNLNDYQVEIISEMIYEDYYFLTYQDIKLCFRYGLKGKYGQTYQNLDIPTVSMWLSYYVNESAEVYRQEKAKREIAEVGEVNREAIAEIQRMINAKMAKKKLLAKTSFQYPTIEAYAADKGVDVEKLMQEKQPAWEQEYNKLKNPVFDLPTFIAWKWQKFLLDKNNENLSK